MVISQFFRGQTLGERSGFIQRTAYTPGMCGYHRSLRGGGAAAAGRSAAGYGAGLTG